jgi:hypothetical protein
VPTDSQGSHLACRAYRGVRTTDPACCPVDRRRFGVTDGTADTDNSCLCLVVVGNHVAAANRWNQDVSAGCSAASGLNWSTKVASKRVSVGDFHEDVLVWVGFPVVRRHSPPNPSLPPRGYKLSPRQRKNATSARFRPAIPTTPA